MRFKSLFLVFPILISLFSCENGKDTFTVTWKDDNGTVLEIDYNVKKGDTPSFNGATPYKRPIIGTSYIFNGWSPNVAPTVKDTTYTATYNEVPNYSITWKNYDGTILKVDNYLLEGRTPIYTGATPKKIIEGEYWAFDDLNPWEPKVAKISQNATYTANFVQVDKDDDSDHDGLADYLDPFPHNNNNNASFTFSDDSGKMNFKVDYSKLVNNVNPSYDKDIAKFAIALCMNAYYDSSIKIENSISTLTDYRALYEQINAKDVERIEITSSIDNDIGEVFLSHHTTLNKENKEVVFIVLSPSFKDTNKRNKAWLSDFSLGADTDEYYAKEGECSEWNNKNYHKGLYVTAYRLITKINDYLLRHNISNDASLFITGHSRGGGLANIIGAYYEDLNRYHPLTYTFGSTKAYFGAIKNYKTIFNVVNDDDIVAKFPFPYLNAKRLGQDIFASGDYRSYYERLVNHSYLYVEDAEPLFNYIQERFPTRESIYDTSQIAHTDSFSTLNKANETKEGLINLLKYYGISYDENNPINNNYQIEIIYDSPYYKLTGYTCLNTAFKIGAAIITDAKESKDELTTLFSKYIPLIDLVLKAINDDINHAEYYFYIPHYLSSYYAIVDC